MIGPSSRPLRKGVMRTCGRSGWFDAIVITKRMVSGEPAYLVRWEGNIERRLTEEDFKS